MKIILEKYDKIEKDNKLKSKKLEQETGRASINDNEGSINK